MHADLGSVYTVARRIASSVRRLELSEELVSINKQIELAWNNLLAFCPNTPEPLSVSYSRLLNLQPGTVHILRQRFQDFFTIPSL